MCISIFQTIWRGRKLRLRYHAQLNSVYFRQSWTKPLRPFQPILQSYNYWTLTKQTLSPPPNLESRLLPSLPPPPVQCCEQREFWEYTMTQAQYRVGALGERGLKKGNMIQPRLIDVIQHGVYHKNIRIFYRGKIVSTVRDDGSLFFIVEVVIVKRKHGACVQNPNTRKNCTRGNLCVLCCVLCNKFVQNQCMKWVFWI
jgi:hypothetical protein